MRRASFGLLAVGLLLGCSGFAGDAPAGYRLFVQRVQPYVLESREPGKPRGLILEILDGAFRAAQLRIDEGPSGESWPDLQKSGHETENSLISPFARTPQREHNYHWIATILEDKLFAYAKKGKRPPGTFAEVGREISIGVTVGSSAESRLKELKIKHELAATPKDLFRKLAAGEIEVALAQGFVSTVEIKALGKAGESLEHGEPLVRVPLWVATSPKTTNAALLKARAALEKFKETPEYKKILGEY